MSKIYTQYTLIKKIGDIDSKKSLHYLYLLRMYLAFRSFLIYVSISKFLIYV